MVFMLHLLEFLLFSVVQTGPLSIASKKQMNWFESFNYCKLSTLKNVKELNFTNVWLGGLYLQTPWIVHRGCFNNTGSWDTSADPYSDLEWNITLACSYKCRKIKYFALKENRCACLNSLSNMVVTMMDNCKYVCNGSKRDPCGDAGYYTVYEQQVENGSTYNRRPVIKWITNETFDEISNKTADFHNVKCLLLNESLQNVPVSCNLNYSALCEAESERELTTETNDVNMGTIRSTARIKRTSISGKPTTASTETRKSVSRTITNVTEIGITYKLKNFTELTTETSNINKKTTLAISPLNKTDISEISTTASPGTRQFDLETAYVTVITVVGALIAIVVILLLYTRKRKRIIYHSHNSASNDIHASLEGEQTIQMFSSNDRSRDRTNTVPFFLQHEQRPDNISVSNYQDPIDMENQYQRLDFSMRSDLTEVHDDYAMQFYKQTPAPAVNDDGSKHLNKSGLTKRTIDLKEVYNNYSLPYDDLSRPPEGKKDDMKIQIKVRPPVTTNDEKHNNVAYCDTAIVHEDFLYDIPKHSSRSLYNRCSVKK